MISAGKLNQRIVIQARSASVDAIGQPVETWGDLATVWADVRHPSGVQAIRGDADVSALKASMRIRFRADVTAAHRVQHDGRLYDIEAVLPNRAQGYVDLICKAVQ